MMLEYTFLPNILVFLTFTCAALFAFFWNHKQSSLAVYSLNLIGNILFFFLTVKKGHWILSSSFFLGAQETVYACILIILNIFLLIFNGQDRLNLKGSILANFVLLASLFLLGAKDFVTYFVALEMVSLLGFVLLGLSSYCFAKEAAIKYLIQSAAMTGLFLMGVALFIASTKSVNFDQFTVSSPFFLGLSCLFFLSVLCFKLGVFPFHWWLPDTYAQAMHGNLASNFFFNKLAVGLSFILIVKKILLHLSPEWFYPISIFITTISLASIVYGNFAALGQESLKRMLSFSSVAHSGVMLMALVLPENELGPYFMFYVLSYALAAVGAFLILNHFIDSSEEQRDVPLVLQGAFQKSPWAIGLLSTFLLSIAGIPLTAGFFSKYLLFSAYFSWLPATVLGLALVASVVGLGVYLKFFVAAFMQERENTGVILASTSFVLPARLLWPCFIFFLAILFFGLYPDGFFLLKF